MSSSPKSTIVTIPPPYMDPGNSNLKKQYQKVRQESIQQLKVCEHCGAHPRAQAFNLPSEQVFLYPSSRPIDAIRQDARQFVSYVIIIAIVIFTLFAAFKYLP